MADLALGSFSVGEGFPPRRMVVLGASNVVRALPTVVDQARAAWGAPLDLLAAIGHGRSYGIENNVLGRVLPGILECELWEALERRPPAPSVGLLTDIGNDILYGISAEQIAAWVEQSLLRLRPSCEKLLLTGLPLEGLERLGSGRYLFLRTLLFPRSRLSLRQALSTAQRLNEYVAQLAVRYDAHCVQPRSSWYGFDPIHIRSRWQHEAWSRIVGSSEQSDLAPPPRPSLSRRLQYRALRPARRWLFGLEQRGAQPALRLSDGSLISLY